MSQPTFRPIINNTTSSLRQPEYIEFDPKHHLAYDPPERIIMMKDIGYSQDTGVSPVAVSQPFRLFSAECIQKFRKVVLNEEVMSNCFQKSDIAACQVRGYCPK